MEHTPGPWKLDSGRRIITPSGTFFLAYGKDKHGNAEFRDFCELDRNAHLVAAAPELLEALGNLLSYAEDAASDADERPGCINQARAAIAKARGGYEIHPEHLPR